MKTLLYGFTLFLFGIYIGIILYDNIKFQPLFNCYKVSEIVSQSVVWQPISADKTMPPYCSVRVVFDGQPKFLSAEEYLAFIGK